MKYLLTLLTNVLMLMILTSRCVVLGERMVRFSFNDGIIPMPFIAECTETEYLHIDPLFDINTSNQKQHRNLRRSATVLVQEQEQGHRELPTYPGKCKEYCAGMARGTCRASGCKGYRRGLQDSPTVDHLTCDAQVNKIHDALDALIESNDGKLLSVPCQRFIRKDARKTLCLDDVVYGEITGFTFFTTARQMGGSSLPGMAPIITKLRENAPNGYSICNTIPFNIDIEVNPCVNGVNVTLTGPNNFIHTQMDKVHPMTVFENVTTTSGSGVYRATHPYGVQYLDPGSYTMHAHPDNFLYKEKKIDFTVLKCS